MTVTFLTDEHVPSVFVTTLRSNGYVVEKAIDACSEGTADEALLQYASDTGHLLITHDKKDFSGTLGSRVAHPGIVIYTDPVFLRDSPEAGVRVLDHIFELYPPEKLDGERLWLDQWRETVE